MNIRLTQYCDVSAGARLFIVARTTEKLEEVKESCEKLGSPEVTILEADMLQEDDLAKISEAVSPLFKERPTVSIARLFASRSFLQNASSTLNGAFNTAAGQGRG